MHQYSSGVFSDSELSQGPLHELATKFLFSSPSVIEFSTLTCTSTTTMFECLHVDMDFCKKQALVLGCCVDGSVLLVQSIIKQSLE